MSSLIRDAIFWIAVVSCAVAQLFIMRAVFKKPLVPRTTADSNSESASSSTNTEIPESAPAPSAPSVPQPRRSSEFAWAVLPAFFLAVLFFGAWRSMHRTVVTSTPITVAPPDGVATQP